MGRDQVNSGPLPLPSWGLILALALPVLGRQALHLVVNLSDRFLAGHLTTLSDIGEGLPPASFQAAQTTALYLAWFISCYIVLVSVGSTALVSRFVGGGQRELANRVTHQSILLSIALGLVATAAAFSGGIAWMIRTLQLQGEAALLAEDYLKPLFALLTFQIVELAGIACLEGAGDTRTGLRIMIGVAVLNVPLAWGFCLGAGPLPRLGFAGISLGTALSHTLGGIAVLAVLGRGRFGLKLHLEFFRPAWDLLYRLLRISVPAGLDSLSTVVGQFWFLSIVNRLGDVASGAHGIALGWEALGYLSGAAFGTAAMTLVGQNLGAGRPEQAARAGWMAFALGCGLMSFFGLVMIAFAPAMFRLFCPDPSQQAIVDQGVPVLRLIAFAMPSLASTIIFTSSLRGAGDTRVPVLFTWVGFFAIRIPLAYYFIDGLELGLFGAWCAMCADLVTRGFFFLGRFAWGAWHLQRV